MRPRLALQNLGLAFLASLLVGASAAAEKEECLFGCPGDGLEYRDALAAAIARADRIVVTEHSSPLDATDKVSHELLTEHEFVYETVNLTPVQRQAFRQTIEQLDPKTQHWASACIPLWHHTVRFYEQGNLASTMRICFVCGHVDWDGSEVTHPGSIHDGMRKVITDLGLHPEREWHVLAHQQLKAR